MLEEYDLKRSAEKIGELYPVILSKDGDVVDGFHRQEAVPTWRTEVRENIDSKEKLLKARLVANKFRRQVTALEVEEWMNELAEIALVEHEIKPGNISRWIAEETGYSIRHVNRNIDLKYKDRIKSEASKSADTMSTIPLSVLDEAREVLGDAKATQLEMEIIERYTEVEVAPESIDLEKKRELREIGVKLGEGVKRAMIQLSEDIEAAKPRQRLMNNLMAMKAIRGNFINGVLYNPFTPDATLMWSDGHTLKETIEEMQRLAG